MSVKNGGYFYLHEQKCYFFCTYFWEEVRLHGKQNIGYYRRDWWKYNEIAECP